MRFLAEQSILFLLLLLLPGAFSDHLGQAIRPDLPFMLYGSDNVAKIQFSEAPCVFVAASPHSDLSDTTFAAGNLERPLGSTVTASQFVNNIVTEDGNHRISAQFGAFCFPNGTSYLDVQFGNYSGLDRSSPEWHSTVFYFMSKEKVNGPCSGRGTLKIGGNVFLLSSFLSRINPNISSECPAVFLAPSNVPAVPTFVPNFKTQSALELTFTSVDSCCSSAFVDAFTVQNGVTQIDDPFIFSAELSNTDYRSTAYLRNAIMLTIESQEWTQGEIGVSYVQLDYASKCSFLEVTVRDADSGRIDSNPYGTQQMEVTLIIIANTSAVEFSVSTKQEECMSLNMSFNIIGESEDNHTNVFDLPRLFILSQLDSIRFIYEQLDGEGCSSPSYFAVDYRGIDTSTTTVAPTAIPTTTSATTTSSSSSTPLATSTINWDETTTTQPLTTTKGNDGGVLSSSTSTSPPTTAKKTTTAESTTFRPKTSTPPATSTINGEESTTTQPLTTTNGKDGGALSSSTSTLPSTTAKKTTTEEITTTSPKTTTTDGKNGAISPQFVVCTTLSALLFSYLV